MGKKMKDRLSKAKYIVVKKQAEERKKIFQKCRKQGHVKNHKI